MSEATPAEAAIERFAVEQTAGWTPVMERQCRAAGGRSTYVSGIAHGPTREPLAVTVVAPKAEQEPEPVLVHACTEHRLPLHRHDGGLLYAACTGDAGCWITGHPRCAHHPEEN